MSNYLLIMETRKTSKQKVQRFALIIIKQDNYARMYDLNQGIYTGFLL